MIKDNYIVVKRFHGNRYRVSSRTIILFKS